ncbi:MAG: hypothetical protein KJP15_02890, partial [Gammaproteobacteria bacterium]|nr:hypothetical protein [Gammaproteobacteria bacterium]
MVTNRTIEKEISQQDPDVANMHAMEPQLALDRRINLIDSIHFAMPAEWHRSCVKSQRLQPGILGDFAVSFA